MQHFIQGKRFLFSLVLTILTLSAFAQRPVQVITTVRPAYSTLLSEYYSTDQEKLSVMLINTDASQPFLQVYLRMTIEGQGVKLQTTPYGNYPTIDVMQGAPVTISQSDLAPYFSSQNLIGSTGAGQNRLPEGFYQFCFEVYEKNTHRLVGDKQCAQAYLTLSDPPFLTMPEKGKVISYTNPFNLLFQWTPRNLSAPNAYNSEYEFSLVEIWDDGVTPEAAFYTAQPIYTTKTNTTNLFYGPAEPPLLMGKKYAWRVKQTLLTSTNQQEPFRNEGYTEIYWFKLQGECLALQKATITADPKSNRTTLSWANDPTNVGPTKLEYRKKGASKWTTVEAQNHQATLTGLAWNSEYEYHLGNRCIITDEFAFGSLQNFKTLTQDTTNCVPSAPQALSNQEPIARLHAGDTIYASGFRMRLTKVTGANGNFSGEGYLALLVPTTTTEVSIRANFQGIGVNTDKQLISGKIVSMYDKTEGGIGDLDPITQGGTNVGEVKTGNTTAIQVNTIIDASVGATVTSVVNNSGDDGFTVTVTGVDGKTVSINTSKVPVVVQDKTGKLYGIDKDGKITPLGQAAGQLLAGLSSEQLNNISLDKGTVTFEAHAEQKYALDNFQAVYNKSSFFSQQYESLSNGLYRVGNKLLITNSQDKITVSVSKLAKDLKADSIHFVTGNGIELTATKKTDGIYELPLLSGPAGDAQELYALYTDKKAGTRFTLGKLKIATYEPKEFKVKLVPVGDADIDETQVAQKLNDIYNPVGVSWSVEKVEAYTDKTWDNGDGQLDIKEAGKNNQYSVEMQKLNKAYMTSDEGVEESTPYLFVFNTAPRNGKSSVEGDMLRNRQFGYLFTPLSNAGQVTAHELAHGMFNLNHIFDTQYDLKEGDLPKNLMDYRGGTELAKLQWDAIHAPGLVIGVFESEGDGAILSFNDETQFRNLVDNKNRIISSFKPVDPKMMAVPVMDPNRDYVIGGVNLYRFDVNTQAPVLYKSINAADFETDKDIVVNILSASKDVLILNSIDRCLYTYQHIIFKDPVPSASIINSIETSVDRNNWKTGVLFGADNSCFADGVNAIIANDQKSECLDAVFVEQQRTQIRDLLVKNRLKNDATEITNIVNSTCKTSLRGLSYTEQFELFETIAKGSTIKENNEIAILRLMQCIESQNYVTFFNALESSSNKLINNLISEMNDKSIYPWDGDNYTNFVGSLLKMVRTNPKLFLSKLEDIDQENTKLYGQIINLDPVYVSNSYELLSSSRITRLYKGKYNSVTGNVTIQDVFNTAMTMGTGSAAGPQTVFIESTVDVAEVTPLTPIFIRSEKNLDIVSTALNQSGPIVDHVYLVPAIFLKYRDDKIFIDNVQLATQLTVDAVSIVASCGTALATKVTWARRLWALAELADGVTSVAVNTGIIERTDKIYPAVEIFNSTMGMIGIIDMATKAPKITRKLSNYVITLDASIKTALINNQSIKAIVLAKYLEWKVAVSNLDGLTNTQKQLILEGKSSQVSQLSPTQKAAFDEQQKFWRLVDDGSIVNGVGSWATVIGKNIDELVQAPLGYQFFAKNGSKYIRRIDATDINTPRLMVDETGVIVEYLKPQRLANSTKLRTNLEKVLGKAPDNHQAHHVVPSNVVGKSTLHQEAMKRGLYDVDRAENGKFLAETDEDFVALSEAFPTHFGSHPNYDIQITKQIDDVFRANNLTPSSNLSNLTNQQLTNMIEDIEDLSLNVLENWKPSKLN